MGRSRVVLLLLSLLTSAALGQKPAEDPIKKIRPILEEHCFPCHHDTKRSAGISLKNIFLGINDTKALIVRDGKVWMNVVKQVESGMMPPSSHSQLSPQEHETLVRTINEILYESLSANNPGRVVMRRLVHTLKGNCMIFGVQTVAAVCHEVESAMDESGDQASVAERAAIRDVWTRV